MTLNAKSMPLVSVVIPVHNTAAYLSECIESVLKQRYSNWELVIVDNASTDGSRDIALSYARQDSRLRVFQYDELLPQVPNYNRALAKISPESKYVKVLEADNWLFPECLGKMVGLAEESPSVAVVSSYNVTETLVRMTGLPLARTVINGRELARMQLRSDAYLFGAPTTVLMRADLVRTTTPFYDESYLIAEDQSACFDALRQFDFGFVHQILSFVRTENESILSKIRSFDPQHLDRLVLLRRHGHDFFNTQEYNTIESVIIKRYYTALAEGLLSRQGPAYWRFHRTGLESTGLALDKIRLARAVSRELISRVLNPVPHLKHLLRIVGVMKH